MDTPAYRYHGHTYRALSADKQGEAIVIGGPAAQSGKRNRVEPPVGNATSAEQQVGQGVLMDLPKAPRKQSRARGHAAMPGGGPSGQSCGTCAHYVTLHAGSHKTYPKCRLSQPRWTPGKASDIRKKDPACVKWQPDLRNTDHG